MPTVKDEILEAYRNSKKKLSEDLHDYGETQDRLNLDHVRFPISWHIFADRATALESRIAELEAELAKLKQHDCFLHPIIALDAC